MYFDVWVCMCAFICAKATYYSIKTSIYVTIYYSCFIEKLPIINYEFFAFVQCVTSLNLKALEIGITSSNFKMHWTDCSNDDDNKECDNNAVFMCEHKLRNTWKTTESSKNKTKREKKTQQ